MYRSQNPNPAANSVRIVVWLVVLAVVAYIAFHQQKTTQTPPAGIDHLPLVEVYFSPKGGCTDAIVREIDAAQQSIYVQAYSFTSRPIAAALVRAHQRGVRVTAVLDKSNRSDKETAADMIARDGIDTFIDEKHRIAHNKIIILDEKVVITGSFNFSDAAEKSNAENLLILRDPELAARYRANWEAHRAHAEPFE